MVEFVRDVIIAVAILATLVAVAVHPVPEPEAPRRGASPAATVAASDTPPVHLAARADEAPAR